MPRSGTRTPNPLVRGVNYAAVRRAAAKVGHQLERERRIRVGRQRGQYYTPEDLGPYCAAGCGTRLVKQLAAHGITEHPACGAVE